MPEAVHLQVPNGRKLGWPRSEIGPDIKNMSGRYIASHCLRKTDDSQQINPMIGRFVTSQYNQEPGIDTHLGGLGSGFHISIYSATQLGGYIPV